MFFVNDPGPWQSFILRGDNVGKPINEVTQKYLHEQLQFDNFISMQQQLHLQQFQNKGTINSSSPTPEPSGDFRIDTTQTSGTTTGNTSFKLPLTNNGTINFTIDWGDGTTDTITTWNQAETTHTYPTPGTYYPTITSGTIEGWRFGGGGDAVKLMEIYNWSIFNINVEAAFRGCINLVSIANSDPTISSTNLDSMFSRATNFNNDIGTWDVSNVTDFNLMFFSASSFNQDISTWNVSSSVTMSAMFNGAISFNQPIGSWDVSNVTNMSGMFSSSISFNQPLSSWDVSNVVNMSGMFNGADAFDQNIGGWDVSNVTNMNDFMTSKTPSTFSTTNLNAIYNGWSALPSLQSNVTASFGTANYTAAASASRAILTGPPNNWYIIDGGQV